MKLLMPEIILKKIESLCKPAGYRAYFLPIDLVHPLENFIDTKLKDYNMVLYQTYKDHRGTNERTLRFAWSSEGGKEDGAIKSLRDLLCYFGFKKNWADTLKELGINEGEVIRKTNETKSKQGNVINSVLDDRNNELKNFAKRIYVELSTRKAAIPIDEDNDIIEEVYDSWYKLFSIIREELKSLSPSFFKKKNGNSDWVLQTQEILNNVLRSHLTEHHAKFRGWFQQARAKKSSRNLSPQKLQQQYPAYKSLITAIKQVNRQLAVYSKELLNFIEEEP